MSVVQDLPDLVPPVQADVALAPRRPALTAVPDLPAAEPAGVDGEEFAEFVRAHEPRLRRYVQRRLGDAGDAEEITQETLLRAHQHFGEFACHDDAAAWCTTVAQRLLIDRTRVRGRSMAV